MSQQRQPCVITGCKRNSRALCHCCQQNLCLEHLKEHSDLLNSQLEPFVDEINSLAREFQHLNFSHLIDRSLEQLDKWRDNAHRTIDQFYDKKRRQLEQLTRERVDHQRRKVEEMRIKVTELIREQDTTHDYIDSLSMEIRVAQQQLKEIQQKNYAQINIRQFSTDDLESMIRIAEEVSATVVQPRVLPANIARREIDLSSLPPPFKSIHIGNGDVGMAYSRRHLLVADEKKLCLFDQKLNLKREILWNHSFVWNICWSSSLERFIIVSEKDGVFVIDERTITPTQVQDLESDKYRICACSESRLYLSECDSISEYTLMPSVQFVEQWAPYYTAKEKIRSIASNANTLACIVVQEFGKTLQQLDLWQVASTKQRLWSYKICDANSCFYSSCSSFSHNEWLVSDSDNSQLLQITSNGKLKHSIDYTPNPWYALQFDIDILAVLAKGVLNFHRLF